MRRKENPKFAGRILARVHAAELTTASAGSGAFVNTPPSTGQGFSDQKWVDDPTQALRDNQ